MDGESTKAENAARLSAAMARIARLVPGREATTVHGYTQVKRIAKCEHGGVSIEALEAIAETLTKQAEDIRVLTKMRDHYQAVAGEVCDQRDNARAELALLRAEHEAVPECFRTQDFLLSKHGRKVAVNCNTFDEADSVFNWLDSLTAVQRKDGE